MGKKENRPDPELKHILLRILIDLFVGIILIILDHMLDR